MQARLSLVEASSVTSRATEAGAGDIQEKEAGQEEEEEVILVTVRVFVDTPVTRATGPVTGTILHLQSMLPTLPLGRGLMNHLEVVQKILKSFRCNSISRSNP